MKASIMQVNMGYDDYYSRIYRFSRRNSPKVQGKRSKIARRGIIMHWVFLPGILFSRISCFFGWYNTQRVMSHLDSIGWGFFSKIKDQRSTHHADFARREKRNRDDEHANVDHDDDSLADLKPIKIPFFSFRFSMFGANFGYVSSSSERLLRIVFSVVLRGV